MYDHNPLERAEDSIRELQDSYLRYMLSLKHVLDHGDAMVGPLISALNHKHANPVAKALGLLMYSDAAQAAIPRLLDWLIIQSPMYPDTLEALVRAGDRITPALVERLRDCASKEDDEAVRHLLDLGTRLSGASLHRVVDVIVGLLQHSNPHIREAAADAIWKIGLPHGRIALNRLQELATGDPASAVRDSAKDALIRLGVE